MSIERTQKIFNFSLNSKISSELKLWESLQKLPKGYGKKLFQNLLEEKFGKPSNPDFEKNMLSYLDLSCEETVTKSFEVGVCCKNHRDCIPSETYSILTTQL